MSMSETGDQVWHGLHGQVWNVTCFCFILFNHIFKPASLQHHMCGNGEQKIQVLMDKQIQQSPTISMRFNQCYY